MSTFEDNFEDQQTRRQNLSEFQAMSPLQWYDRQQKIAWLETCWNQAYRRLTGQATTKIVSYPIAGIEGGEIVESIAPEQNQNSLQAWLLAMWLFP
jgi:hypothetical protein